MKRRYKLLLIIFISFILIIIFYKVLYKKKKMYLSIGYCLNGNFNTYSYIDYLKNGISYFNFNDFTNLEELNDMIDDNYLNINYYIKNASFITISLDTIELCNYEQLNDDILEDYLNNIDYLFKKLSANKNVYFINTYDNSFFIINEQIKKLASTHHIYYIDSNFFENDIYYIKNNSYLSTKGHKKLSNLVKKRNSLLPR